jgi:hypothetical protein
MKRTFLAAGVAVIISMLLMPMKWDTGTIMRPFFLLVNCPCRVLWTPFALQTAFAAVAAAVIVNLLPRRK